MRDLHAGRPAPPDALVRTVLAKRDIMDALVVDVGRRNTLRANDLWLREQAGRLWLAGADASPWAVPRRLGRGWLGRGAERRLVDWKDVEFLIMTNQLVCVAADLRVGDARRELEPRIRAPDFAQYLYVVDNDDHRHLQGVVSLREFAVADDQQLIGGLMNPRVTTIDALEPAAAAARRVAQQHLAALPITSRDGRLLGAITVDAALAQLAPASWRDQAPRIFS